ncbi:MAG: hypothetical protein P8H97_10075 [Pseudomonadales bacterium]|nr:hypothetical protein [Pseudomonadales bacterium]
MSATKPLKRGPPSNSGIQTQCNPSVQSIVNAQALVARKVCLLVMRAVTSQQLDPT